MKADRAGLKAALDRLPPDVRLVLLAGPDDATSRDLARRFALKLGGDDPMARTDLDAKRLRDDPGRLADEAAAVSMFGDARLIMVADAGDDCAEAVALLLDVAAAGNPAILIAGDLKPTSKLRKLAEASPRALAVISYPPDARDSADLVAEFAAEMGLRPDRNAVRLLVDACSGDRGVLRREIEKLALYLDADPADPKSLDTEHLSAVGASLGEGDFGALVDAVAGGRPADADRQAARLRGAGVAGITQLRGVSRRLWLLLDLRLAVDGGASAQAAVAAARPPVFWKDRPSVQAQIARWRVPALRHALDRLSAAERAIKSSGSAGDVLAAQALLAVAVQAGR